MVKKAGALYYRGHRSLLIDEPLHVGVSELRLPHVQLLVRDEALP